MWHGRHVRYSLSMRVGFRVVWVAHTQVFADVRGRVEVAADRQSSWQDHGCLICNNGYQIVIHILRPCRFKGVSD